jgi:hypothetical protein
VDEDEVLLEVKLLVVCVEVLDSELGLVEDSLNDVVLVDGDELLELDVTSSSCLPRT